MKKFNVEKGRLGEDIARKHLEKKGYKIVEQNYRTRYAEIDLVAKKKDVLVFVEVRTKIGELYGSPEDTLNKRKLARVRRNAIAYAAINRWDRACRIDAICIVLTPDHKVERLEHYENIV